MSKKMEDIIMELQFIQLQVASVLNQNNNNNNFRLRQLIAKYILIYVI